jgi:hypothetical protein
MASSAPKVAPPERRDPLDVIDKQADELVALIEKSKHFIVFTGAGVSTSAGKSIDRFFLYSPFADRYRYSRLSWARRCLDTESSRASSYWKGHEHASGHPDTDAYGLGGATESRSFEVSC